MHTIRVNDLQMVYTERGDGPPAVALHAATANSVLMGWIAAALSDAGFRAITPDQRGHGKTDNPAGVLHLPLLLNDLIEFVYQLGLPPVHGVGYSMGGGALLYAARQRPDLFRSLILIGTSWRAGTLARIEQALGGPLSAQPEDVQRVFDPEKGVHVGWDAPLESFQIIAAPTLLICADRDEFHDVEEGVALYRALPNAELLVVPQCDHFGFARHPIVLEAVRDFYSRIPR
jgi:pimeloyl-ACP methyl ester carboxylesterase